MPSSTPLRRSPKAIITTTKTSGRPTTQSPCSIQPATPANLVGTTLAVTPTDPTWGSTITVTAQITNQSSGSSPQTRALLSLTPQGLTYGGSTTVGHRQHHRTAAGALPDRQPGTEHHLARRRALFDRQLHQFRPDDGPGCRLPHQRPLSPPARPGCRARPGGDHASPPARPRRRRLAPP